MPGILDTQSTIPKQTGGVLVAACQNAVDAGALRLIVLASALGEAQDVYFALCKAQMDGKFSTYTLRLAGKAARVAEFYAKLSHSAISPWSNAIRTLNSKDYFPAQSIVITGGFENADGIGNALVEAASTLDDTAIIRPSVGFSSSAGSYTYSISLHASLSELFATAVALKCRQVALYHGQHGNGNSPLATILESVGRSVVYITETPKMVGGSL